MKKTIIPLAETKLNAEVDKLKKENKQLKLLVLKLQYALTAKQRKLSAAQVSATFNEAENVRMSLQRIKQSLGGIS